MNLELIQEKWDDILQSFKEEHSISDISFKSWLLPLEPTSIEDDTLIVVFDPKDDQESDPDQMGNQLYHQEVRKVSCHHDQ